VMSLMACGRVGVTLCDVDCCYGCAWCVDECGVQYELT
jgi:hypothetical protein